MANEYKPAEPKNAGNKEPQNQPPMYPDDYDFSGQPNQPSDVDTDARISEKARRAGVFDKPKKRGVTPPPTKDDQES